MAVTRLESFVSGWGHLTGSGDLILGDLDLKFSGSCRTVVEKPELTKTRRKTRGGGDKKDPLHQGESYSTLLGAKRTYSLLQSNTEGSVARMRKHDMSTFTLITVAEAAEATHPAGPSTHG